MSGKRKAKAMSASEPEDKNKSKKARLAAARAKAAEFAARDKAKVQNAKAAKSGAPSIKAIKSPKNQKTPQAKKSPDKTTPKSERRKIARENALKFAAQDQAKLKSKKKASPNTAQVDDVPSPVPKTLSSQNDFGTAIDPTQVEAFEEMRKRLMRQDAPSESDGSEEIDDEDDIAPPPPALMAQVSTQVLLNARKAQADDSNSVASEEVDEAIANDNIDVESVDQPKSGCLQSIALLVVVALIIAPAIAIGSMMVVLPSSQIGSNLSIGEKVVPKKPLCYFDSAPSPDPEADPEAEAEESCSNIDGVSCPKGGVCEGGKLIGCDNIFQDVLEQEDKCVLGDDYVPMRDTLMDLLVSHASKVCDHSSPPAFPYTMLQEEQPTILEEESGDLIAALADEGFIISEKGDGLHVGLPEGFKVSLPLYCHVGNISQWAFQEFGFLLLGVLRFVGSNLWGLVSLYPLPTVVFLILLGFAVKIQNYLAAKRKRQDLLVHTRKLAYKVLEELSGKEVLALHIRDGIANDNYADDKKVKLEFQKYVWPKIVADVKRDTRVRKSQTIDRDGKPRDVWMWTAVSKSSSES